MYSCRTITFFTRSSSQDKCSFFIILNYLYSEMLDEQILDDDYSKIAFLCADRSIRLHAKYGSHYSLRIPRYILTLLLYSI